VTIHAPDAASLAILRGDAPLTGGDLLPGFALMLTDLFA
jgi:hypothetical protein